MKRVLVTGASGFFGRHAVAELLRRGYDVHACARGLADIKDVEWHSVNLLNDAEQLALLDAVRPSHMLHLAWNVGPGFSTAPDNIDWTIATLSLLRAFHRTGGTRFVAAGTCAEYDWRSPPAFMSEDLPRRPATLYGNAKDGTRRIAEAYSRQTGLSCAWGILFMAYGEGERPERLVPSVIRSLIAGQETKATEGTQLRDFLDSRDVGAALAALVDSPVEGSVNVASGQPMMLKQLIGKLGELAGRPDLIKLGSLPMRADEPPRLVADVRKLSCEVGFVPRIGIEQGLSDAIAWWRHNERR